VGLPVNPVEAVGHWAAVLADHVVNISYGALPVLLGA
jgi:hypothetical protein